MFRLVEQKAEKNADFCADNRDQHNADTMV